MKRVGCPSLLILGALLLIGCAPAPTGTLPSTGIQPGSPAEFHIQNAQLLQAESWPVQVRVEVSGTLTSSCHQVETSVTVDDTSGEISVEVSEQKIEGEECPAGAAPFRESIPLGSYSSGDYRVLVNGDQVGEFDLGSTQVAPARTQERGPVFVDQAELEFQGQRPVKVDLLITGSLPTPCATLHWSAEAPDEQGRINIELYSLQDPELACIQVLEPLDTRIPIGSFSQGSYSVWLNGEQVGDIQP